MSLAHEDLAIIAGGALVTEEGIPVYLVFLGLYAGIVGGDMMIYGIGRLARHVPWLRKRMIGERVRRAGVWLDARLFEAIAVCKVTPGLLFPTFLSCGWLRISFPRFLFITLSISLVYTSVALSIVLLFGEAILRHLGYGAWAVLGLAVVAFTYFRARQSKFDSAGKSSGNVLRRWFQKIPTPNLRGMPVLSSMKKKIGMAERIPPPLFYTPVGLRWLWLGLRHRCQTLPALANPLIEGGGFWGESKSECMRQIADECQKWVARFATLVRGSGADSVDADLKTALEELARLNLEFPIVAKPDIGWQGFGVRLLSSQEELRDYIARYPQGEVIILQQYVPYDGECGVFYVRKPGGEPGRIYSLTFRYFPHVVGDGKTTLRDLILGDQRTGWKAEVYLGRNRLHCGMTEEELNEVPGKGHVVRLTFIGSIRAGALYRDGSRYITETLTNRIDEIAQSIPEFHYGRFDLRFGSIEQLQQGEDFFIFEINGAGAEAIQIWDPEMTLRMVYRTLFEAQSLLFEVGQLNRKRGFKPISLREFMRLQKRQHALIAKYPPSA